MNTKKISPNRYEAVGQCRDLAIPLSDGKSIHASYVGYGDTAYEAIKNCINKISRHLYPVEAGDYVTCASCGRADCMCYEDAMEGQIIF